MYNDEAVLKIAAYNLDSNDIVKTAGAVQSIKNWLQRMLSPEYRKRVDELNTRSGRLQSLLSDLVAATDNVQKAVTNADNNSYEEHLQEVRILVADLNTELEQMEDVAEQASVRPEVEQTEDEPSVVEGYKQRHRPGYNMPMGDNLDISFQSLNHLTQSKIVTSDGAKNNALRRAKGELESAGFPMEVFGDSSKIDTFFNSIVDASIKGTVISNRYSSESVNAPSNPVEGRTRVTVRTPVVEIPALSLSLEAEVVFLDRWSQVDNPQKILSLFRVNKIWNIKYSGETPNIVPKSGEGRKVLFLVLPEDLPNDDQSKTDIINRREELKGQYDVDVVQVSPRSEIEKLTNHYIAEGYEVVGTEVYQPKVSAAGRKMFLRRLVKEGAWQEDFIALRKLFEPETSSPRPSPRPSGPKRTSSWMKTDRHVWARKILQRVFPEVMGREGTPSELQLVQGVGLYESDYGRGWKGPMKDSKNWGAIQYTGGPNRGRPENGVCPPGSALQGDSKPTASGKNKKFTWCYKTYPTHEAGAADLIKTIFKTGVRGRGKMTLAAAESSSLMDFSSAMYDSGYYGGFGATRGERIAGHVIRMNGKINEITQALNEDVTLRDVMPTNNMPKRGLLAQQINSGQGGPGTMPKPPEPPKSPEGIDALERMLWSNDSRLNVVVKNAIARKILPKTQLLIVPKNASEEYVELVCQSLNRIIGADTVVNTEDGKIKITCSVPGNEEVVTGAVQAVCDCVSDQFEIMNKQVIKTAVYPFVSMKRTG